MLKKSSSAGVALHVSGLLLLLLLLFELCFFKMITHFSFVFNVTRAWARCIASAMEFALKACIPIKLMHASVLNLFRLFHC